MKKTITLIYGLISYAIGMGAFTYTIGFSTGVLAPVTVDAVASETTLAALVINVVLVALFGIQHSVMARAGFKALWTKIVPEAAERSTYVLATALVTVAIVAFWQPMAGTLWHVEDPAWRLALNAIAVGGWLFCGLSSFAINHWDLFGLRQTWLAFRGKPYTPVVMKTPNIYRVVRHPMLLGALVGMWATPDMGAAHLTFALGMSAYILVGMAYEERDLIAAFGEKYKAYQDRTPALLPFFGTRKTTQTQNAAAK